MRSEGYSNPRMRSEGYCTVTLAAHARRGLIIGLSQFFFLPIILFRISQNILLRELEFVLQY